MTSETDDFVWPCSPIARWKSLNSFSVTGDAPFAMDNREVVRCANPATPVPTRQRRRSPRRVSHPGDKNCPASSILNCPAPRIAHRPALASAQRPHCPLSAPVVLAAHAHAGLTNVPTPGCFHHCGQSRYRRADLALTLHKSRHRPAGRALTAKLEHAGKCCLFVEHRASPRHPASWVEFAFLFSCYMMRGPAVCLGENRALWSTALRQGAPRAYALALPGCGRHRPSITAPRAALVVAGLAAANVLLALRPLPGDASGYRAARYFTFTSCTVCLCAVRMSGRWNRRVLLPACRSISSLSVWELAQGARTSRSCMLVATEKAIPSQYVPKL